MEHILMGMKGVLALAEVAAVLLGILGRVPLSAQSLKAISLGPPVYPPIATAARVEGEVHLRFALQANGAPINIQIVSGPPMLQEAAEENAKDSEFQPVPPDRAENSYELTYRFVLDFLRCEEPRDSSFPHIQYESNSITISAQAVPLCDPEGVIRVRSLRCLYLWRCGLQ